MKDFTQSTKDEAIAILSKEIAERQDNIRLPYNPKTIDNFLDNHKWCRTAQFNFK
jgi:hypothetical protein